MTIAFKEKAASFGRLGNKLVPNKLARPASLAGLRVQQHSPKILFGVGLFTGAATVVTACRATLQLEGVLSETIDNVDKITHAELHGQLPEGADARKLRAYARVRGASKVAKLYAPSFGLGVMAVASLTGSHHIMTKRNVALTAAYSGLEKAFDEYRDRVVDKYGEDADRNLAYGVKERTVVDVNEETGEVKKTRVKSFGDGRSKYARVFDEVTSGAWQDNSYSNRTFLLTQQQWANDLLNTKGYLFLNDVWKMLGMEETSNGQIVGWVLGHKDSYVDFGFMDKMNTNDKVHDFMFGEEKSVLIDPNVDGPVFKILDELRTTQD